MCSLLHEVNKCDLRNRGFKSWEDLLDYDSGKAHQEIPVDAEFQTAIGTAAC
tara:strand:+ start:448 stop:603 length:156 start_codon:yes stop_codon:yes gene_type:complete